MKVLLVDLETAPNFCLVWGLFNQNIGINQIVNSGYTLCWSAKWLGKKGVMFDSVHQSSSLDMITRLHSLLDEADAVIHYNGNKFDIPVMQREFLLHGLPPTAPFKQIDLLRVVRKQFKFTSNKLDYVSQMLGLGAKTQHKGMELWTGCMNGNDKDWKVMKRYNVNDVVLLEKLYYKLLPWIHNHPNVSLYDGATSEACANCGSHSLQKRGMAYSKVATYQRYQCNACGSWMRSRFADKTDRKHLLVREN